MGVTIEEVRKLAMSLPETTEESHFDKRSFRVRGKIYAVIQEDLISLVVKTTKEERLAAVTLAPEIYSVTDGFQNLNYMKLQLDRISLDEFRPVLIHAWRLVVPKSIAKEYENGLG